MIAQPQTADEGCPKFTAMQKLEHTRPTAAENLALDLALLDACAMGEIAGGVLRIWEPAQYFVVLGRSSRAQVEVNLAACREEKIPVLRRASGGGTILAGPGCLMYAVVLSYRQYPELRAIDRAHQFVRQRHADHLSLLASEIRTVGTSDLAIEGSNKSLKKFSGNSLRAKRTHFIYHGTLLYDFDLDRMAKLLALPTREPEYRDGRQHTDFVTNLPLERAQLVTVLTQAWQANKLLTEWPQLRMEAIVNEKFVDDPNWVIGSPE